MSTTSDHRSFAWIDADNHYYETGDCFSRHIESKYRDLAIHRETGTKDLRTGEHRDDLHTWKIGDRPIVWIAHDPAEQHLRPGAMTGFLSGHQDRRAIDPDRAIFSPELELRAAMTKSDRLAMMDAQNLEACLMLPTIGVVVQHDLHETPDVLQANIRAFNRWIEDEWGYGADRRIFGAPVIDLLDVDWALGELARVCDVGARFFYFKMGPIDGRSPAHPHFDRFWADVQDRDLTAILHIDNPGYTELISPLWGEPANVPNNRYSAFQNYSCHVERAVQDSLAALVLHNLFGRYPRLRMLVVECGSEWTSSLLRQMDKAVKMTVNVEGWFGGRLLDAPSDVFRQHISISPFAEDDVEGLVDLLGAERVLFGSDWPHPEGLGEPGEFLDRIANLDDHQMRRVMHDNAAALLGLPAST